MFEINIALPLILIIFLTTLFLVNRILFRPMLAMMEERKKRTIGGQIQAGKTLDHYQKMFAGYQEKLKEAYQEGYRHKDIVRGEAMQSRRQKLAEAQEKAQGIISGMKSDLSRQIDESKHQLRLEANGLAESIASRILLRNN